MKLSLWLFVALLMPALKVAALADELPHSAISVCRRQLEDAKQKYEASTLQKNPLQVRSSQSALWGQHGEPPSVTFTVEGAGNSLDLVWYKGRDNGSRPWVSDDRIRFLGSARGGSVVTLWGSNTSWLSFAAAFRSAAEACLQAFVPS